MTNMLPRDRAEQILAEHAAGKSARAIARGYGHKPETIRNYVSGRRTPGEAAPRADEFTPFTAYCRQRLAHDPHLRAAALLAEITSLGFPGTQRSFYRALERHEIKAHPCPDCHIARMSGYAPLPAPWQPRPAPLPVPAAPVTGETLASFLGRLAAANLASTSDLLKALPPWFRVKTRWHDDRWQPSPLTPLKEDAAARLAAISGSAAIAIKNALPAFGHLHAGQPVRAANACRLCAAARGIQSPVPVHLPAWQQVCLKHGIWLPAPGTPQISVSNCPDILDAERRARRLLRRRTTEQLIYARIRAREGPASSEQAWKHRIAALIESNPRQVAESSPRELFLAAAYPDAITAATTTCGHTENQP
jgi:hypothetical protein